MTTNRREFIAESGRWLFLTSSALAALDYVISGTAQAAPTYDMQDHWWGMIIDIDKCIGCGNCVQRLRRGKSRPRWLLPHLGGTLSRGRLRF